MSIKHCGRCERDKDFSEFNKTKNGKYGLCNHCRECQRERKAIWDAENHDKIKEYTQKQEVKEKSKLRVAEKYKNDPIWRAKFLEENKLRRRKEPAKIKQRANEKHRRKTNLNYRLRSSLNSRINKAICMHKKYKKASSLEFLGCVIGDFIKYIESLFTPGMTWENYGNGDDKWQIDHIIPCAAFDLSNDNEMKVCFNYKNLQPLWALDNIKKGSRLENGMRCLHKEVWTDYSI